VATPSNRRRPIGRRILGARRPFNCQPVRPRSRGRVARRRSHPRIRRGTWIRLSRFQHA
jgi:hypothetical protein